MQSMVCKARAHFHRHFHPVCWTPGNACFEAAACATAQGSAGPSSPCVTRRQMLSGSVPVARFCRLPHRNNRSNTARESRQTFRAPTVFITSKYQSALLDMRSLEGKKRRKKKGQISLQSTSGSQCGDSKKPRSLQIRSGRR